MESKQVSLGVGRLLGNGRVGHILMKPRAVRMFVLTEMSYLTINCRQVRTWFTRMVKSTKVCPQLTAGQGKVRSKTGDSSCSCSLRTWYPERLVNSGKNGKNGNRVSNSISNSIANFYTNNCTITHRQKTNSMSLTEWEMRVTQANDSAAYNNSLFRNNII